MWSALSCVFIVGKNVVSFEHRVVNTWSVCNESIGLVVRMRPAASGQATVATAPPTLGSTDLWPCRLSITDTNMLSSATTMDTCCKDFWSVRTDLRSSFLSVAESYTEMLCYVTGVKSACQLKTIGFPT